MIVIIEGKTGDYRARKCKDTPLRTLILLAALSLVLAGCGLNRGGNDEAEQVSIEDAETCEDVADYFAVVAQEFIDEAEAAGLQALAAGPDSELFQRYMPRLEQSQAKANELGCDEDTMRPLLADRLDDLETSGPVGTTIVNLLDDQLVGQ
jgi:hypothetical protein